MADGGGGLAGLMEMTQQGAHLGVIGQVDQWTMPTRNEQARIAVQITCQDLFQRQAVVNAWQALNHLLDTFHFRLITPEVLRVDGALIHARRIPPGRHQNQLVTGLEQVVGGHAELVEVITGGVLLAALERQLVLAGKQHQHLPFRRGSSSAGQHCAGKGQRQSGNLGHGESPDQLKGARPSGRASRTCAGAASQSAVAAR
ncbi:hypothetical protein FQZ97_852930 [compost metagenome]